MHIFHHFMNPKRYKKKEYLRKWRKNEKSNFNENPFVDQKKIKELMTDFYCSSSGSEEEIVNKMNEKLFKDELNNYYFVKKRQMHYIRLKKK